LIPSLVVVLFIGSSGTLPVATGGCRGPGRAASPESVVDWARGSGTLAPRPRPGAGAGLFTVGKGQAMSNAVRVRPGCSQVVEVLPAPASDPRVFFLDAQNVVKVALTPGAQEEGLENDDPALGVLYLLGFARAASPLELLVAAKPHGADRIRLYKLTVAGRTLTQPAVEVTGTPAFDDVNAFFQAYSTPRCLEGGHDCLLQSPDAQQRWFLELEKSPQGDRDSLLPLGDVQLVDVVWNRPGETMYVLMPC
jgi:hypothetical protein